MWQECTVEVLEVDYSNVLVAEFRREGQHGAGNKHKNNNTSIPLGPNGAIH